MSIETFVSSGIEDPQAPVITDVPLDLALAVTATTLAATQAVASAAGAQQTLTSVQQRLSGLEAAALQINTDLESVETALTAIDTQVSAATQAATTALGTIIQAQQAVTTAQAAAVNAGQSAASANGYAADAQTSSTTSASHRDTAAASSTLAASWAAQLSGSVNGTQYKSSYAYALDASAAAAQASASAGSVGAQISALGAAVFATPQTLTTPQKTQACANIGAVSVSVTTVQTLAGHIDLPNDGLSVGTNQLVAVGGRVGVGTTPYAKFHAKGTLAEDTVFRLEPYSNSYASKLLISSASAGDGGLQYGAGGTNDMDVFAYSAIRFYTGTIGGSLGTERMRLSADGSFNTYGAFNSLGVATLASTSVSYAVPHYWNGTAFTASPQGLKIINAQAGGYDTTVTGFMTTSAGTPQPAWALGAVGTGPWADGNVGSQTSDFYVLTRNSTGSLSERIRITPSGNMGVGTSAPAYTLDVNGTLNATDVKIAGVSILASQPSQPSQPSLLVAAEEVGAYSILFPYSANGYGINSVAAGADLSRLPNSGALTGSWRCMSAGLPIYHHSVDGVPTDYYGYIFQRIA